MYTNSNGEKIKVDTLETTHLVNALAKKYREIFDAINYNDFVNRMSEINTLKDELYKRINIFSEKLGD